MRQANFRHIFKQPLTYVGIGVALVTIVAFIFMMYPASAPASTMGASTNEKAYQNVVTDSLGVYKARYSHYPDSYETLMNDITNAPDIYGVNQDGLASLESISDQLSNFSYASTANNTGYMFTYHHASDGKTETVKNK